MVDPSTSSSTSASSRTSKTAGTGKPCARACSMSIASRAGSPCPLKERRTRPPPRSTISEARPAAITRTGAVSPQRLRLQLLGPLPVLLAADLTAGEALGEDVPRPVGAAARRRPAAPAATPEEPHQGHDHGDPQQRPERPPRVIPVTFVVREQRRHQVHLYFLLYAVSPAGGGGSTSSRGRARSSQDGIPQFARPNSSICAGTSTIRTTVASRKIAVAIPAPISFRKISSLTASARKTTTMIAAAEVITRAVLASPSATARDV